MTLEILPDKTVTEKLLDPKYFLELCGVKQKDSPEKPASRSAAAYLKQLEEKKP